MARLKCSRCRVSRIKTRPGPMASNPKSSYSQKDAHTERGKKGCIVGETDWFPKISKYGNPKGPSPNLPNTLQNSIYSCPKPEYLITGSFGPVGIRPSAAHLPDYQVLASLKFHRPCIPRFMEDGNKTRTPPLPDLKPTPCKPKP